MRRVNRRPLLLVVAWWNVLFLLSSACRWYGSYWQHWVHSVLHNNWNSYRLRSKQRQSSVAVDFLSSKNFHRRPRDTFTN